MSLISVTNIDVVASDSIHNLLNLWTSEFGTELFLLNIGTILKVSPEGFQDCSNVVIKIFLKNYESVHHGVVWLPEATMKTCRMTMALVLSNTKLQWHMCNNQFLMYDRLKLHDPFIWAFFNIFSVIFIFKQLEMFTYFPLQINGQLFYKPSYFHRNNRSKLHLQCDFRASKAFLWDIPIHAAGLEET